MIDIIANSQQTHSQGRRKETPIHSQDPGQFIPLIMSSGGVLQQEMQHASTQWSRTEIRFWNRILPKISCLLIEYRAHAYIWIT